MELTNEELFKQALKDSFSRKIQSRIDSFDEEISYSKKHLKVMQKIIEGKTVIKYGKKQIAAILIAAALLLLTACAVIYRDEINGFLFEIREQGLAIFFEKEDNQNKFIEEIYEFTYIPEGFVLKKSEANPLAVDYIFENSDETAIRIQRKLLNTNSCFI